MKNNRGAGPPAGPHFPQSLIQTRLILGSRFSLRFPSPDVAAAFQHILGGFPATEPSPSDIPFTISSAPYGFSVSRNGLPSGEYRTLEELLSRLESTLLREALNRAPDPCIHAGAVALGGSALLLAGTSGSGKTTLVLGLALKGWTLLSDEIVPVRPPASTLEAFPRVLCVKNNSLPLFQELDAEERLRTANVRNLLGVACIPPGRFNRPRPGTRFTAGAVVFPAYRPGAPTRLEEISRAEALARLIGHTANRQHVGRLPSALGKLVEGAPCFNLTAGALAPALDLLETTLQRTAPDADAPPGSNTCEPPGTA